MTLVFSVIFGYKTFNSFFLYHAELQLLTVKKLPTRLVIFSCLRSNKQYRSTSTSHNLLQVFCLFLRGYEEKIKLYIHVKSCVDFGRSDERMFQAVSQT